MDNSLSFGEAMLLLRRLVVGIIAGVLVGATSHAADRSLSCTECHQPESEDIARSVHASVDCRECHGGAESYDLSPDRAEEYLAPTGASATAFDHGKEFRGKTARAEVPELCGDCHANVERMNPYGLRTDQLARYRTSGHGKTLAARGDDRVAVCVDCHGSHGILGGSEPASKTHPLNIPDTCATCHADPDLMGEYDLPVAVVEEYRQSVHGQALLEESDTGAPTCATCHGNHSAIPPGFATVGAVCGQCHQHAAETFRGSIHANLDFFEGCVQCHGGGENRHFHQIERITKPTGVMIQRYKGLLSVRPEATPEEITDEIHPDPKRIMTQALPMCLDCHEELDEDESLPRLFDLLDRIAEAERRYVRTARRLDEVGQGVLLVEAQRFAFQEARTHLIELAPVQHTLDPAAVADKVAELNAVCDQVDQELDDLETGLRWRYRALVPVWGVALVFSMALYVKYKRLKSAYVKPLSGDKGEG